MIPPECVGGLLAALSDAGIQAFLLDEVDPYLAQKEEQNFEDQGATFGAPWAPLSPRTIAEKARRGFPEQPLVRYGRLASDLGTGVSLEQSGVGQASLTVGTPLGEVPYAARLHAGDASRNLPSRVLAALTPDMEADLENLLREYILQQSGVPAEAVILEITA